MTKMMFKTAVCLILAYSLSACQSETENQTTADETKQTDAHLTDKTTHPNFLRLPLDGKISSIDPGKAAGLDTVELVEQLFLSLTTLDPQSFYPKPELATHWQYNDAGDQYTFYLRKDARWQNGRRVTAHDVVWGIRHNLKTTASKAQIGSLYLLKNGEAIHQGQMSLDKLGVRVLDDYTVEFQLQHPLGSFPAAVSLPVYSPLPREAIEAHGDDWTKPENIITNAAYQVTEWLKNKKLVMKKNPSFYDADKVRIPEIHYLIVPENSMGLTMYVNNKLDILGESYLKIPSMDLPLIKLDPVLREQQYQKPSFCTEAYVFNASKAPYDKLLVRKAIAAAINKRALIDFVIQGEHQPAGTFIRPPTFGSVDPDLKMGIAFNPAQAKKWLTEAGYLNGEAFPNLEILVDNAELHIRIAEGIKLMLHRYLNIETELIIVNFETYQQRLNDPKTANLIRLNWCGKYPDAHAWLYKAFHPKYGKNYIRWENTKFAMLTELAQQKTVYAERLSLYYQAEQILNEKFVGIIPLYFANATYLVKPWIKDWDNMPYGGQHIRDWGFTDSLAQETTTAEKLALSGQVMQLLKPIIATE